ncbi:hypothetical protein M9Y10_015446 [Tritrichomonas musculus]|uniref:Noncanonical pyrimidine nucleotidase, YjjG family n=1 Tax=Tritrichomonas musculus TaxID=1915356 RepID=A0ABR2L2B0_9EUKA
MNQYEYILFDADGTLYDFPYAEEHAIQETWDAYKIPVNEITLTCFRKHNIFCWKQLEEGLIGYDALQPKRFELMFGELGYNEINPSKFNHDYIDNITKHSKLFPQSLEVLKELKNRGYKLFIITNGIYSFQKEPFNREETKNIFEKVFYSQILNVCKPDKKFFDHVFKGIGLENVSAEERKKKVIVVGDSLTSDIQGGINANLDTIWFNPNKTPVNEKVKPTFVINQLNELLDYFPSLKSI